MSIKYGTYYISNHPTSADSSFGAISSMLELKNLLQNNFLTKDVVGIISDSSSYKKNGVLCFPNNFYGIFINGFIPNSGRGYSNKGYYFIDLSFNHDQTYVIRDGSQRVPVLSNSIAESWTDPYSVHYRQSDGNLYNEQTKIPYARYAINDNGDWILSFDIKENWNNNRYNYGGGSAYYIGTKLDGKDIIIDQSGTVWDNTTFNTKTEYSRLTRLNPVYYNSKQTHQIALTDFLIRNNAYDIKSLENIKLAITYRGNFDPYLIKDNKGDEYCIIPASCPSESALVLRDTKE